MIVVKGWGQMIGGKITWARPMGALAYAIMVTLIHVSGRGDFLPWWADAAAPLMLMTWFISRELWKYMVRRIDVS